MKKNAFILLLLALAAALLLITALRGNWLADGVKNPAESAGSQVPDGDSSSAVPQSAENETRAAEIMAVMSLEEKIYQMLIVRPEALPGEGFVTEASELTEIISAQPVGGIIFSADNLVDPEQTKSLINGVQSASDLGLFIAVDEEGGRVTRVARKLGTTDFSPMYVYRGMGEDTAYSNAATIAADIRQFGFNLDFAPVADVWTNPDNEVIGQRAYSDDPIEAAALVSSAVLGFQENGIIATLKHFPGHGGTAEDSHLGSAYSDRTYEDLFECELLPFISGIEAGAGMVMMGHITMTSLDGAVPAGLSSRIVTGILREDLGFDGVVITDSLEMQALSGYSAQDAAVMAVEAGVDILLSPGSLDDVVKAIMDRITPERIDESVMRILTLKLKYGIIE